VSEQALHPRRRRHERELLACALGVAAQHDEHAEAGAIDELDAAEVEHDPADAGPPQLAHLRV
jgi:hypothetical protein